MVSRNRPQWRNDYWYYPKAHPNAGRVYLIHTRPTDDLRPHPVLGSCWCQPARREQNGCVTYTHHAADGRELVEVHGLQ
jgi:hypothetical protein